MKAKVMFIIFYDNAMPLQWLMVIADGKCYKALAQIPFSNVTTAQRLGILGRTLGYVRFSTDDFRWIFLKIVSNLALI